MPEYQGSQFLPLMQQKWKQEEADRLAIPTALGAGLQAGVVAGVDANTARKKSQYDMAMDMIKERLKNVELVDMNDKPLGLEREMQVYNSIASGQFKGWDKEGIKTKPRETSIYDPLTGTTKNVPYGTKIAATPVSLQDKVSLINLKFENDKKLKNMELEVKNSGIENDSTLKYMTAGLKALNDNFDLAEKSNDLDRMKQLTETYTIKWNELNEYMANKFPQADVKKFNVENVTKPTWGGLGSETKQTISEKTTETNKQPLFTIKKIGK